VCRIIFCRRIEALGQRFLSRNILANIKILDHGADLLQDKNQTKVTRVLGYRNMRLIKNVQSQISVSGFSTQNDSTFIGFMHVAFFRFEVSLQHEPTELRHKSSCCMKKNQ
jgi:hypothetical protein